jgi:transcriptional regulator with XRE-family HTH domain
VTFGETLRREREKAGLSREGLRRAILRHYPDAPAVNTIRDLENGSNTAPQSRNLTKLMHVLSLPKETLQECLR